MGGSLRGALTRLQVRRGGMVHPAVSDTLLLLARRVLSSTNTSMELTVNALVVLAGCTVGTCALQAPMVSVGAAASWKRRAERQREGELAGFVGAVVRRFSSVKLVARAARLVMSVLANGRCVVEEEVD